MSTRTEPPRLEGCDVLPPLKPTDSDEGEQQGKPGKPTGKLARRRTGDRFAVLNNFVDFTMGRLRRSDIAVWLVLYRDVKKDGVARTGQTDIARRAGVSERTVRRTIRRLEARGLLVVVRRGGLSKGPSAYRVRPIPPDSWRTQCCPVITGQTGAFPADTSLSGIP